jgi:CheY-like chemotaxis protein
MPSAPLILCVDDDAALLAMTRKLLETAGYRVLSASSGAEALRIASGTRIDAVVLDYTMPDMDGPEVAAALRERVPQLPIVFYTGSPERVGESGMRMADGCVEKGEPLFTLVEVIGALLDRNSRRKFVRHPVVAPLGVRIHRPGLAATLLGRSFDLSEGGVGGSLDGTLLPGQVVSMSIQLPNQSPQISSTARIAYRNGERYGFQFLALPQPERERIRAALASGS